MENTINAMFRHLVIFLEWILQKLSDLFPEGRNTINDADFAPASELLSAYNKGFVINGKALPMDLSFQGCLITAGTGKGKSSCVTIPTAINLRNKWSMVIHDPNWECFLKSSGALHQAGQHISVLNYLRPEHGGFNPLKRIKGRSDIMRTSELLVYTPMGKNSKDPIWNLLAASLVAVLTEVTLSLPPENQHLYQTVQLLNTFSYAPEKIDRLVIAASANSPQLLEEYKALVSNDSKMLKSIIVTAKAALQVFSDPMIALATSFDTIDFEQFRKRRSTLFITNSVTRQRYLSPVSSILFSQLFDYLLSNNPTDTDLPVGIIGEEMSSMRIPDLSTIAANIRKTKCGLLLIYQSLEQLEGAMGKHDAKAVRDNCYTTAVFPGAPIDQCKEIAATLGSFDYWDSAGKQTRLLLSPAEIHKMNDSLILCGNSAIRLPMKPYYEDYALRALTNLPPVLSRIQLPYSEPPTISL